MGRRTQVVILGLVFLGFPGACTKNRRVASQEPTTVQGSTPTDPTPEVEERQASEYTYDHREKTITILVKDARLLFNRGEFLFREGQTEEARLYFEESLDILRTSGIDLTIDTRLEGTYFELLDRVRHFEMSLVIGHKEPPLPFLGDLHDPISPLDEIAGVDLYTIELDPDLEDRVNQDVMNTRFDFPVVVNKEVVQFLDYYQGRGRKLMEEALARSGRYVDRFREIFAEEGLPQDLVYMAHTESLFKPRAYSRARARGIWQFVAGTARLYGMKVDWWLDERLDIFKATRTAARHLRDLHEDFGDWYLALAGYNGGPGRVTRVFRRYGRLDYWTMAKRRLLPRETRNYVPSILAAIIIYKHPENYGFFVEKEPRLEYEEVQLEFQVDLQVVADTLSIPVTTAADLNPELVRGVTPDNLEDYRLKVPPGTGEGLLKALAKIPADQRLRLRHHQVKQGETLSHIASRYGVPIRAIADYNRIRNIHRLSLGQNLIIPVSSWKASRSSKVVGNPKAERHIVRRGDSLYEIALFYGVSVKDLFTWNNLSPGDYIHPGQEIRVSAGTGDQQNAE